MGEILEWVATSFSRGFFPTQGSNPHLLHWQWILCCWAQGSSYIYSWLISHKYGGWEVPSAAKGKLKPQGRPWYELQSKSIQAQDPRKADVSVPVCKQEKIMSWLRTVRPGDPSCFWKGQPFRSVNIPGHVRLEENLEAAPECRGSMPRCLAASSSGGEGAAQRQNRTRGVWWAELCCGEAWKICRRICHLAEIFS